MSDKKKSLLEVRNVTKSYGTHKVLSNISFTLGQGEILGLVGANGSGKSTLLNILFGNQIIQSTGGFEGTVLLEGQPLFSISVQDAISQGIGMIHQEFMLIPEMTVTENINLLQEETIFPHELALLDHAKNKKKAQHIMEQLGFQVDPALPVKSLSVSVNQFVEIGRELSKKNLKLLLLDEPTAVLNDQDSKKLVGVLKTLAKKGISIIFCSHRLHEIVDLCDQILVLRDGEQVMQYKGSTRSQATTATLARQMVGHEIVKTTRKKGPSDAKEILRYENFSVKMPGDELHELDLSVYHGEILGVTSLSGHGKSGLGYGMMGRYPSSGRVIYQQKNLRLNLPGRTIQQGIFLIPDDRKNLGLLMEQSVESNVVFSAFHVMHGFQKKLLGFYPVKDEEKSRDYVKEQIEKLEIRCISEKQSVAELSGGNQQKVCIARALALKPQVLIVMEPTRGVDLNAKEKILQELVRLNREEQTTILMISSELEELKRVCDRIVVLSEGKKTAILSPDEGEEIFGLAYAGEGGFHDEEG